MLIFVFMSVLTQTSNSALLGTDPSPPSFTSISRPILTISDNNSNQVAPDVQIETVVTLQQRTYVPQTVQSISDAIAKDAYVADSTLKIDTYTMATTLFNSQKYFGDMCNRCKSFEYFAFRMGNGYLTAGLTGLNFQVSSSPSNSQLFIGEQQIDGTWAFRSLTQGKYIRASNDGVTINWQTYVGPWERWYIERHGNHAHVQSAQFQYYYWVSSSGVLQQLYSGASAVIV